MLKSKFNLEYPRVSLFRISQRLAEAKILSDSVFATEDQIARALGYKGLSGASMALLTSLKKFGLLFEDADNSFRFHSSVEYLFNPLQNKKRIIEDVETIAFTPEIFRKIRDRFGKTFPDVKDFVQFLSELQFSEISIPRVMNSYFETLDLLSSLSDEYVVPGYFSEKQVINYLKQEKNISVISMPSAAVAHQEGECSKEREKAFYFQIPDTFEATVVIRGRITVESLDSLIRFLEVSKKSFSKNRAHSD